MPQTEGSCYVIHTGPAGACDCNNGSGAGPAVCSGSAHEIKAVRIPAADQVRIASNVVSVLFDPAYGTSTPTGTMCVICSSGREVHHIDNIMGRVRSCSPLPAVPGRRAC